MVGLVGGCVGWMEVRLELCGGGGVVVLAV